MVRNEWSLVVDSNALLKAPAGVRPRQEVARFEGLEEDVRPDCADPLALHHARPARGGVLEIDAREVGPEDHPQAASGFLSTGGRSPRPAWPRVLWGWACDRRCPLLAPSLLRSPTQAKQGEIQGKRVRIAGELAAALGVAFPPEVGCFFQPTSAWADKV